MRLQLRHAAYVAAAVAVLIPLRGYAQGSLAVQGVGYPPGQFSTRTGSTGGALAEIDPLSPINPAALGNLGTTTIYFQAEPEYRRVEVGGLTTKTSQSRFPVMSGGFTMGSRWAAGLSFSTIADRTWQNAVESIEVIGGEAAHAIDTTRSRGAINDTRFALAYAPISWLQVGVGFHAFSGQNQVRLKRVFVDPDDPTALDPRFAVFADSNVISYGGNAISAGIEARAQGLGSLAISYRAGGRISAESGAGDSVIGRANLPDRLGISLAYLGIARSAIAVRAARESWSELNGIGQQGFRARDTWDYSVGGDIAGPRFGPRVLMLRVGARWRDLPFAVVGPDGLPGPTVRETSIAGGIGTLLANGRTALDLGVIRASRTADLAADVSERSWFLSIGLTVRP